MLPVNVPGPVVIRPARHDDLPAIFEIPDVGNDFLYAQGSMFLDDPNVKAFVAVVDGKPIGWFEIENVLNLT